MTLVDSGAFIALIVSHDAQHPRSVSCLGQLPRPLWTLDTVISETYTHLRYRFGSRTALAFLEAIALLRSTYELRVAYVDAALAQTAESILRQYADVKLSYVDATALAWLRGEPSIKQVFGFDEHWRLEGRLLVPS